MELEDLEQILMNWGYVKFCNSILICWERDYPKEDSIFEIDFSWNHEKPDVVSVYADIASSSVHVFLQSEVRLEDIEELPPDMITFVADDGYEYLIHENWVRIHKLTKDEEEKQ